MRSFLVIGGGLVGAASALRLQAAGVQTALVDIGDRRRGASFGNAGHLGAEQVTPWSTWDNIAGAPEKLFGFGGALDFRWSDLPLWGPWSLRFLAACSAARVARGQAALSAILAETLPAWRRLADLAGAPEIVLPHGHLSVWMTPAGAEQGLKAWSRMQLGTATAREMTIAELARFEGVLLRPPAAGMKVEGTGQVRDPQGARDAILSSFQARGGEIVYDRARSVDPSGRVRLERGGDIEANSVLVACGAWSGRLMQTLGLTVPLIGERGYSVQSGEHNWPEDLPTTVFEERFVVLSRFTSGLRATSFLEYGSPDAPGDPRKWDRLEMRLRQLGVRFSATPDRWVGPRPSLPDFVPAIGRLRRAPKILYAFGHQHLGLTMCAATAEIIEALATERPAPIDTAPFAVERFS